MKEYVWIVLSGSVADEASPERCFRSKDKAEQYIRMRGCKLNSHGVAIIYSDDPDDVTEEIGVYVLARMAVE